MSRTHCERTFRFALDTSAIHSEIDALHVLALAMADPPVPQVFALITRRRQRCTVLIVDDTRSPDAVLDVAEVVGDLAIARNVHDAEVVLATVRPDGADEATDGKRWRELDARLDGAGIELLDWFVLTPEEYWSPRARRGEPDRW